MTSPPAAGRPYGGASPSARAAERERRLVAATLDLVGDGGVESLTAGSICARASVAKRYFYDEYDSLDDLLDRTFSDALSRVSEAIAGSAAALGVDDGLAALQEAAVRAVLDVFDDPRVARLYLESPGFAGLRAARSRAVDGFVDQFVDLLAVPDAGRNRARLLVHVVVAGTTDVVASWLRGDTTVGRDQLVTDLVAMGSAAADLVAALPTEGPGPR